jgi:hypothetical protein
MPVNPELVKFALDKVRRESLDFSEFEKRAFLPALLGLLAGGAGGLALGRKFISPQLMEGIGGLVTKENAKLLEARAARGQHLGFGETMGQAFGHTPKGLIDPKPFIRGADIAGQALPAAAGGLLGAKALGSDDKSASFSERKPWESVLGRLLQSWMC